MMRSVLVDTLSNVICVSHLIVILGNADNATKYQTTLPPEPALLLYLYHNALEEREFRRRTVLVVGRRYGRHFLAASVQIQTGYSLALPYRYLFPIGAIAQFATAAAETMSSVREGTRNPEPRRGSHTTIV